MSTNDRRSIHCTDCRVVPRANSMAMDPGMKRKRSHNG